MTPHRWLSAVLMLLFAAALAAPAQRVTAAPLPLAPEEEPNDSAWEANHLAGRRQGRIGVPGDVDYYIINDWPGGLDLTVSLTRPAGSPLQARLTLYDINETLLTTARCDHPPVCLTYRLPEGYAYYLRVEDVNGNGGNAYEYAVDVTVTDPNEPNDFLSQATPYTVGETMTGLLDPVGDVDFYSFWSEAGVEYDLDAYYMYISLFDADGNWLGDYPPYWDAIIPIDDAGTYYLRVQADYDSVGSYDFSLRPIDRPLALSFDRAGTLGGVAFTPGDIVAYSPLHDTWSMYFDASDMGLRGNLTAFDANNFMLVYATPQRIPGVGQVTPQDVIQFYGETGPDTSGYLELIFDGSDVGLSAKSESIDALSASSSSRLLMSTTGSARLPYIVGQLLAQRDDVLEFIVHNTWPETSGYWWSAFDGAQLHLGKANLIGLDFAGDWYFVFDRPVTLGGVAYGRNDIIRCHVTDTPERCDDFSEAFDGALVGSYRIDAISILPAETD